MKQKKLLILIISIFCISITSGCKKVEKVSEKKIVIAMVPKLKGIDYFNACYEGAKEAVKELKDIEIIFEGPNEAKVDKAIEIIEHFITQRVDVIAVSANDPFAVSSVLKKARKSGIHVITWDADANPEASEREFFVNQATPEDVGRTLVDVMALEAGQNIDTAIVTASLTAANQNEWMKWMKKHILEKYPRMRIVTIKPSEEDQQLAFKVTQDIIKAFPTVKGIWGISSVAFPGVADAIKQAGLSGRIAVTGLSTPLTMKPFVNDGTVKTVVLWNPVDLGYLTVYTAYKLARGQLKEDDTFIIAGRLGKKEIKNREILLGKPYLFNIENINNFNF